MTSDNPIPVHKGLYACLWRWHFYAGLFCLPFVLLLAVSGSIYLFKPQIDQWLENPYHNLDTTGPRASAQAQIDAALSALPGAQFLNYRLPQANDEAALVSLRHRGERQSVYVHPHSLAILKVAPYERQFTELVRSFHGELLAGRTGSIFVELAGGWAIILILTGLYLWWPRDGRGLAGVLWPRLSRRSRPLWRDLHAVTGFWIAAFTLFLLVTALPWTLVWGTAFKELRQWHSNSQAEASWSQGRAQERAEWGYQAVNRVRLPESVLASARAQSLAPPVELSVADPDGNLWKLRSLHQNRPLRQTLWLDGQGRIQERRNFSDKSALDQAIGLGIAAHEGQLFGWINQLLGLLTALGLVLLSVSGFVLWRKRKPKGRLGAPSARSSPERARGVFIITSLLSLTLPLVFISFLLLVVCEHLLLRRIPGLNHWLGLTSLRG